MQGAKEYILLNLRAVYSPFIFVFYKLVIHLGAPLYRSQLNKLKLRNITDGSDELIGSSGRADVGNTQGDNAHLMGAFTIVAEKVFELQHYCDSTQTTQGFGVASNFGVSEVYAQVKITKIAD